MRHIPSKIFVIIGLSFVNLFCLVGPAVANQTEGFSGGSVLNILFLGVIAYFLVRMFRRKRNKDDNTPRLGKWTSKREDDDHKVIPMDRHEAARQMWNHLSSDKPRQEPSAQQQTDIKPTHGSSDAPRQEPAVHDQRAGDFSEEEFLEGAKLFFSRFQEAHDKREFDELKIFLSDEVYTNAVAEVHDKSREGHTEVMLLNARLVEVKSEGERTEATVFYDARLRRGVSGEQQEHVRTVWEFSRNDSVENGLWTLEKINKVDQ